jgi:ribosomal protein L32E
MTTANKKLTRLTAQVEQASRKLQVARQSHAHVERNEAKWWRRYLAAAKAMRLRSAEKNQLLAPLLKQLPAPDPTDPRAASVLTACAAEAMAGEYFGLCVQEYRKQRGLECKLRKKCQRLAKRADRLQQAWQKAWLAEAKAACSSREEAQS